MLPDVVPLLSFPLHILSFHASYLSATTPMPNFSFFSSHNSLEFYTSKQDFSLPSFFFFFGLLSLKEYLPPLCANIPRDDFRGKPIPLLDYSHHPKQSSSYWGKPCLASPFEMIKSRLLGPTSLSLLICHGRLLFYPGKLPCEVKCQHLSQLLPWDLSGLSSQWHMPGGGYLRENEQEEDESREEG